MLTEIMKLERKQREKKLTFAFPTTAAIFPHNSEVDLQVSKSKH